jgi:NADH-quinone oxidoreductase subunit J
MTGEKIIFFILATSIVVFSIASVFDRRILRAAIYLLFVLVAIAGLFYMMGFEFLASIQLILYAGGIVVLIIFSILLTSQINGKLDKPKSLHLLSGVSMAVVGIVLAGYTVITFPFEASGGESIGATMRTIGLQLMDTTHQGYALPFEVISILLLAALVGTIFIARRSNV